MSRVDDALKRQREQANKAMREAAKQQRQAKPNGSRIDKDVKRKGGSG